jgi:hypothetical protein
METAFIKNGETLFMIDIASRWRQVSVLDAKATYSGGFHSMIDIDI